MRPLELRVFAMNRITVTQLVSHLPALTRRAVLSSEGAMLEHLRGLWKDPSSRALLEGAAVKHRAGDRLLVDVEKGEHLAGKALMYAVLKLVDRLPEPAFQPPTLRVMQTGLRAPKQEVAYLELPGLGKVRIGPEDYYTEAELRLGESLDTVPLEQLGGRNPERPDLGSVPQVSFEPDLLETGETAHFAASSREGHWGTVYLDGLPVTRTRWWLEE